MHRDGSRPAPDVKGLLGRLADGITLSDEEMHAALDALTSGAASAAQMAAFLMALRMRGETVAEITGAARLLRERMVRVAVPADAIDIVGTGGDGLKTYNVSTCAAFVAAGAGVVVAKHGNRSVSSLSGASDVLSALGVKIDLAPDQIAAIIARTGVGFLWAPMHHPAMKVWAPIRAELGLRTLFNLLGPLCNPGGVTRQVLGVYDRRWVTPLAEVLANLGCRRALVVHGLEGLDELSTAGPTAVAELREGRIETYEVTPEKVGLARCRIEDLRGGDAAANAAALRAVLDGERSAYRDIVLLNAGAALLVADRVATLTEGVELARQSLDGGAARAALARLIEATQAIVTPS